MLRKERICKVTVEWDSFLITSQNDLLRLPNMYLKKTSNEAGERMHSVIKCLVFRNQKSKHRNNHTSNAQ